MARQKFSVKYSDFLAMDLFLATTEHTKRGEIQLTHWPDGTPYSAGCSWRGEDGVAGRLGHVGSAGFRFSQERVGRCSGSHLAGWPWRGAIYGAGRLGHLKVAGVGADFNFSVFCPVFLSTCILGTVFPISLVLSKRCSRFYWKCLFRAWFTRWYFLQFDSHQVVCTLAHIQ